MDKNALQIVALRYRALFIDICRDQLPLTSQLKPSVLAFVTRLAKCGFCVSEELLHALTLVPDDELQHISSIISQTLRTDLNWTPLVKGWDTPTNESYADHLATFFANVIMRDMEGENLHIEGSTLPCGHFIPEGTFPIERYNGCPYCGTPFRTSDFVHTGQASKLKELRLFVLDDLHKLFRTLLTSPTPLDASQRDTLNILLKQFPLPNSVSITMKETAVCVIKSLTEQDRYEEAGRLIHTPTDILRFLWYEKTGLAQIIEPKTLIANASRLYSSMWEDSAIRKNAKENMKENLKLHYGRERCRQVALWFNALPMSAAEAAENMNPKRGIWVRFIRALRLVEYSHRPGFEHLHEILDSFHHQDYTTWQGAVDKAQNDGDKGRLFNLLMQRPGLFARSLFSTMLRFGPDETLKAFRTAADSKLPARLFLSLANAAELYFDPEMSRQAKPITGGVVELYPHPLLKNYTKEERDKMVLAIQKEYQAALSSRFAAVPHTNRTIYIDPSLFDIPISIGDRSATIQDTSCALTGTRFPVEGDTIRLFMHWGSGLPAQHLDMDLSARIIYANGNVRDCAYYNLRFPGARHSGDYQYIPDQVGTAEYIDLDIPILAKYGAKYAVFTSNAFTDGSIEPNTIVGWMDSAIPMKIDRHTGVAFDPSCVQHHVRISENRLSKGLVFGVLDIEKRTIIWLEMPFSGQIAENCSCKSVERLLLSLKNKLSVGQLLTLKAEAQDLDIIEDRDTADEAYTYQWALNPADVSQLLNI